MTGWVVLGLLVLVLVIIATSFFTFRKSAGKQRSKSQLQGYGLSVKSEASSDLTPGVSIKGAISRQGGIAGEDETGRGVHGARLDAQQDIIFTNRGPTSQQPPKQ